MSPAQVAGVKRRTVQRNTHHIGPRNCLDLGVCNCPTSYCQHDTFATPLSRTDRLLIGITLALSIAAVTGFAVYLWTQLPLML